MLGRRVFYILALMGAAGFYLVSGSWFSWMLLLTAVGLPLFSLVLSVPAITTARIEARCPEHCLAGEPTRACLEGSSRLPLPPYQGKIGVYSSLTGERKRMGDGDAPPTEHCGALTVTVEKARVYDYLGLFSFPARAVGSRTVLIRPRSVVVTDAADSLDIALDGSECGVRWTMPAHAETMTDRETAQPKYGPLLVILVLGGSQEELDRKLGRLTWLGNFLLERRLAFEVRAMTADGIQAFQVTGEQGLKRAVDTLLRARPAQWENSQERETSAAWQYHIGGEPDEH